MSQGDPFRDMFFEETQELLDAFDSGLAGLNVSAADKPLLDQTYRAIHSLKGAAGMVGMATISEFALAMERVLSKVRTGTNSLDAAKLTLLATARRHLEVMIKAEQAGSPVPVNADLAGQLVVAAGG